MTILEASLQAVLDAREARLARQQTLLSTYTKPIVSFTMNIAGPKKRSPLSDLAFREGLRQLEGLLGPALYHEINYLLTGCEALLVYNLPAQHLKQCCLQIEDSAVGRLYDLDVITPDGVKLSRKKERTCLVCGNPVAPCARSRAHGLAMIQAATQKRLADFAAEYLADKAISALIDEVDLTPKPGLVDRRNNGAHTDMDLALFHHSATVLRPYFQKAVYLGLERADCMSDLQIAGLKAEAKMLDATGGVNTHRGAIYAFGLVLAAMGSVLARGGDLFEVAATLAAAGTPPPKTTHGGIAKTRHGASGARGEALNGFPHARLAYSVLLERNGDPLPALLTLLEVVEDTNLLYRGGPEGLRLVQEEAGTILRGPEEAYVLRLEKLDDLCIARNLSPGGCADLLALGLLLYRTRDIWA